LGLIYRQANRELGPVEPAVALHMMSPAEAAFAKQLQKKRFRPELNMARKDRVSRRLLGVFKFWNTPPQRHVLTSEVCREGKPTGEIQTIMEWKDVPNEIKDRFFPHLREIELLPEMAAAFQMAGLDRTQPKDWYQLVALFAWAYLGGRRSKGAPTKWDSVKYCRLIADFNEKSETILHFRTRMCLVCWAGQPPIERRGDRYRRVVSGNSSRKRTTQLGINC
jgi:hypothetical protein